MSTVPAQCQPTQSEIPDSLRAQMDSKAGVARGDAASSVRRVGEKVVSGDHGGLGPPPCYHIARGRLRFWRAVQPASPDPAAASARPIGADRLPCRDSAGRGSGSKSLR
ncbi:hypothetical protein Bbelb_005230 [Branchiostoma belcheri]|nr:hypothetical protein Bbelb_005230 [Branchiostoma belcheri]